MSRAYDPVKKREQNYRRRYGITTADYERMSKAQNGKCAICGNPPKRGRLHVDHSHDPPYTVRMLLCIPCNHGLSHLEDPVWYANAMAYLKWHHPERHLN